MFFLKKGRLLFFNDVLNNNKVKNNGRFTGYKKQDEKTMASLKIFYFNATEVAALVGMSPFSSGKTSLIKAWKSTNPSSLSKAQKAYENGELQRMATTSKKNKTDDQENSNKRCLNGIEREPIILDIVEKMYNETYESESDESSISSEVESVYGSGESTGVASASQIITYGSLIVTGIGINLLNYLDSVSYYNRYPLLSDGNNMTSFDTSFSSSSDGAMMMTMPPHFVPMALLLNSAFFIYSAGIGYLLSSKISNSHKNGKSHSRKQQQQQPPPPPVVERNCETKYMYITPAKKSFEIKIGGRCDGLVRSSGEIIECKARQNKLFHKVYDTEKVQAIIYLAIMNDIETKRFQAGGSVPVELDFIRCKLIEEYEGEVDVHLIEFDLAFYEKVRSRLVEVCDLLYKASVLCDPKAQLQIFKMRTKADDDDADDENSDD